MTRKFLLCAITTAVTSCLAYLVGAWIVIYGFRRDHPDLAPSRVFNEVLLHLPVLVFLLTGLQLSAFAFVSRRFARVPVPRVIAISVEVSGIVALIHGLLSDFSAFDDAIWCWLTAGCGLVVILATLIVVYFTTRDVRAVAA